MAWLTQTVFLENGDGENLQNFAGTAVELQLLFEDGHATRISTWAKSAYKGQHGRRIQAELYGKIEGENSHVWIHLPEIIRLSAKPKKLNLTVGSW